MGEIIRWILLAIAAVFGISFGVQKAKANKAVKAKEKAEEERDTLQVIATVQQQADKIKDELVQKKAELAREEKEVVQSIASIPEEKEVPLGEDIKKLAADQYARARDRAERLQNRTTSR